MIAKQQLGIDIDIARDILVGKGPVAGFNPFFPLDETGCAVSGEGGESQSP